MTDQEAAGRREDAATEAWARLMRAQAAAKRELEAALQRDHGISLSCYEALYVLRHSGEGLKRVELAERLMLTPSGVTRLLEGLESDGLVERVACATDRRVSYTRLTEAGVAKLEEASHGHRAAVRALFEGSLGADEVGELAELLGKLPGALEERCPVSVAEAAARETA